MSRQTCNICPRHCTLEEGESGYCCARSNHDGEIRNDNYGMVTLLSLDQIEKKSLRRFYPGSRVLSVGSYGCNLRCPFCQNYAISMADGMHAGAQYIPPEDLVRRAGEYEPAGNIGLAFTYNEPVVGYEYVRDCARLAARRGFHTVLATNGYICEQPLGELLPYINAMCIDLKGFSEASYSRLGGDLKTVCSTIETAARCCHVEVTVLVIPGENDTPGQMRRLSSWLAGISPEIALHINRFFPHFHMADREATPVDVVFSLADVARRALPYVYVGSC